MDVFISQLNKLAFDFFANGDYVIITNNFGNVILHPNSHRRKNVLNTHGTFPPEITLLLEDVEHSQNKSSIEELARLMIDREQGNLTTSSLFYLQNMPKGEETLLETTYFYGPIPDTPFAFAIASRHKLGFADINSGKTRQTFDKSKIIGLHKDGYLKLKSRYNCSIEEFSLDKYHDEEDTTNSENNTLFCDFEKATVCEPNHCVKRHFQNMMYDLHKIYNSIIDQRVSCEYTRGFVTSCFVITGSGVYASSKKDWLEDEKIESGPETLELKTKNQDFKSAILVTRPVEVDGSSGLYVNIAKSVSSTSQAWEMFLATVGMQVNLDVLKEIVSRNTEKIGNSLDVMIVDENMFVISGFKTDGGATDGKRLNSFYPNLANKLVEEMIFFKFNYHECDQECTKEERRTHEENTCIGDSNTQCHTTATNNNLELCCRVFTTYSRKKYPLHVPIEISILSSRAAHSNCTCKTGDNVSCVQECTSESCTATYAVADIPKTNILVILNLTPDCTQKLEDIDKEQDVIYYDRKVCEKKPDYFNPSKKCFSVNTSTEDRPGPGCKQQSKNSSTRGFSSVFGLILCFVVDFIIKG